MPDYSLVPVDYQPDFGDVSFVPVDYDPFSADDMIQQARTQLASQPQRLAASDAPIPGDVNAAMPEAYQNPNVGLGAGLMRAAIGLATLPQRAIDASTADEQHFGEDGYTPEAIGPAIETALTMMGGSSAVPMGTIPVTNGVARAAETLAPAAAEGLGLGRTLTGGAVRGAENAPPNFYRGDQAGLTEFRSYAARAGGQANSEAVLAEGDLKDLMMQHALDSRNPPSPFISVTTDPNVARTFTGGTSGSVYQLQLAPGRAIPNPFNPLGESEYLVPHYISPGEIKGTLP